MRGSVPEVDPLPLGVDARLLTDISVVGDDVAAALGQTMDRSGPASGVAFAT
jgi:hypothetical protein